MAKSSNSVYMAGLHDGFRIANEKEMTPQKHKMTLASMTSICQKIYEYVPIQEAWSASQISTAMARKQTTSTRPDMKTLEGCLNSLKEAGLVKERERGAWQQVVPRDPVRLSDPLSSWVAPATPEAPAGEPVKAEPAKQEDAVAAGRAEPGPERSPAQVLGDIATSLRLRGQALIRMADEIDDGALAFEQRLDDMGAKLARFNQLRALLTEA